MRSRAWPWLVVSILLWIPLIMPMNGLDLGIPFWPFQLLHFLLAVLLLRTPLDPSRRAAPTLAQCALRSLGGAITLGVGTWIHLLCDGGALGVDRRLFLVAGTFLGALLGPLAIFEHRAATRPPGRRNDLTAAFLTGWCTFLLLCLGWIHGYYAIGVLGGGGAASALEQVQSGAIWLGEDPWWTFRYFGWSALPAAAFVSTRLRGWPVLRQQAFGLSVAGAATSIFPAQVWAISFGLVILPLAMPLVARVADLKKRRADDPGDEEREADSRLLSVFYRVALVACVLSILAGGGRMAYRARKQAELGNRFAVLLPQWQARKSGLFLAERSAVAPIVTEVAAIWSSSAAASPEEARPRMGPRITELEAALERSKKIVADETSAMTTLSKEIGDFEEEQRRNGLTAASAGRALYRSRGSTIVSASVSEELDVLIDDMTAKESQRAATLREIESALQELKWSREILGLPPRE
jgi:hypothetical protein